METCSEVVNLLRVIHSPLSTNENRLKAQERIEEFKEQCFNTETNIEGEVLPSGVYYSSILWSISSTNPSTDPNESIVNAVVRHFAIQVLELTTVNCWNGLAVSQREFIKGLAFKLMTGVGDILEEPQFVKEKIAQLVVDLVKRDWPQRWPNLFETLKGMTTQGLSQCDMALMVWRAIPEELSQETSTLPEQRKREINTEMTHSLKPLLDLLFQVIEFNFGAMTGKQGQEAMRHYKLVDAVLTTLLPVIDFAQPDPLINSQFPEVLCRLLVHVDLRLKACECLFGMVSKKGSAEEKAHILKLIGYTPLFYAAVAHQSSPGNSAVDYPLHKRLAQVLAALGSVYVSVHTKPGIAALANEFLELMWHLYQHPSHSISSILLPFWILIFSTQDVLPKSSNMDYLIKVLGMLDEKIRKTTNLYQDDSIASYFDRLDFDSHEEYVLFFGKLRGSGRQLVMTTSQMQPGLLMEYCATKLSQVLTMASTAEYDKFTKKDLDALETKVEAVVIILTWSIHGITHKLQLGKTTEVKTEDAWKSNPVVVEQCQNILHMLSQVDLKRLVPLIIQNYFSAVEGVGVILKESGSLLSVILEKIQSVIDPTIVINSGPHEQAQIPSDIYQMRRAAFHTLSNFCNDFAPIIVAHCPPFVTVLQQQLFSNGVLVSERTVIIGMLASLSRGSSGQGAFLKQYVEPLMSVWLSEPVTQLLSSNNVALFLQNLGLFRDNPITEVSKPLNDVWFVVETMAILSRNDTISPELMVQFLPNLCGFTQLVHSLWSPSARDLIPREATRILEMSETAVKQLLTVAPRKKSFTNVSAKDNHINHVQTWLDTLRESAYQIFSHFLKKREIYTLQNFPVLFQNSILNGMNCPQELYSNFLAPVAQHVITVTFDYLDTNWKIFLENNKNKSEKLEVLDDKFLRDVTRNFLYWHKELLLSEKKTEEKKKVEDAELEPSVACRLFFSSEHFVLLVSKVISSALGWPDSLTLNRALALARKLFLPMGGNGAPYINSILKSVVMALMIPAFDTLHSELIEFIRKVATVTPICINSLVGFITHCNQQKVEQLLSKMSTENERGQKVIIEQFLTSLGISVINPISQTSSRRQIMDLPEQAAVREKKAAPTWHDEGGNIDIDKLKSSRAFWRKE
ncbi:exportin-5-like [Planoprotostelium fungivorum]|uniref:Exportin-5-like n=1 Tax=Planoprotostelium fungivorum TaxID=1890364 RepID=A0A2P6MWF0_9EUKA|nr:exportin-5-like [Planoprotostelium fungivorum]